MQTEDSGVALAKQVASLVDVVGERYVQALAAAGSRLVATEESTRSVLAQAKEIVLDVASRLDADRGDDASVLAQSIGVQRAVARVHPSESMRAATTLFASLLEAVDQTSGPELDRSGLAQVALVADRVIADRIRLAAGSYVGHLMNEIDERQESERRRVGRDLHDHIGSNLAAVQRRIELAAVTGDTGSLIETADYLGTTMDQLRALISDLRAWRLTGGLGDGLRGFLDDAAPVSTQCVLTVNGDESALDDDVRNELFLMCREAARNAFAHARANLLAIHINIAPREAYALIEDDGAGFHGPSVRTGSGLGSMRERASLCGGDVVITTEPGHGTRVEILVPTQRYRPGSDATAPLS